MKLARMQQPSAKAAHTRQESADPSRRTRQPGAPAARTPQADPIASRPTPQADPGAPQPTPRADAGTPRRTPLLDPDASRRTPQADAETARMPQADAERARMPQANSETARTPHADTQTARMPQASPETARAPHTAAGPERPRSPQRPLLIGELAAATSASPRALRHYEQAGLIVSERAANGYRRYDAGAVVRVRNIRRLVEAGLTLDDVRVFLPCLDRDVTASPPSGRNLEVALRRLAVMDERIAAQIAVRDRLAAALHEATGAPTGSPTPRAPDEATNAPTGSPTPTALDQATGGRIRPVA